MSASSPKERLAAVMREQMVKMAAAMEERIAKLTDDDVPQVIAFQPMPQIITLEPPPPTDEVKFGDLLIEAAMNDPYGVLADVQSSVMADPRTRKAVQRASLSEARAALDVERQKAATPEAMAARKAKKEEAAKRLVPSVEEACAEAKCKPAGTDDCLDAIWNHLTKEAQDEPIKTLKRALTLANAERKAKKKRTVSIVSVPVSP